MHPAISFFVAAILGCSQAQTVQPPPAAARDSARVDQSAGGPAGAVSVGKAEVNANVSVDPAVEATAAALVARIERRLEQQTAAHVGGQGNTSHVQTRVAEVDPIALGIVAGSMLLGAVAVMLGFLRGASTVGTAMRETTASLVRSHQELAAEVYGLPNRIRCRYPESRCSGPTGSPTEPNDVILTINETAARAAGERRR